MEATEVKDIWDIRRILIIITRKWWWPFLSLVLALGAAWAYLRYVEPTYKSDATIQVDLSIPSILSDKREHSTFPTELFFEGYMEIFTLHEVVKQVVDTLHLDWEIYSSGKVGRTLIFPLPFYIELSPYTLDSIFWHRYKSVSVRFYEDKSYMIYAGDSLSFSGEVDKWVAIQGGRCRIRWAEGSRVAPGEYEIYHFPRPQVITSWQQRISIVPKRGLTVLQVSIMDKSPTRAAYVLNMLLHVARDYEKSLKQIQYERAIKYIDTLLAFVGREIGKVQDTLAIIERQADAPFMQARREYALRAFTTILDQSEWNQRKEVLNDLLSQVQSLITILKEGRKSPLTPITSSLDDKELGADIVNKANDLIQKWNQSLRIYHENAYPLNKLREDLIQWLTYAYSVFSVQIKYIDMLSLQIQKSFFSQRGKMFRDISMERDFSILMENLNLSREIYKMLLEKKIQFSIDKEAIVSSIRITQPSIVPIVPLYPNPFQVYVIALAFGLISGVGGIILWYAFTQTVSYRVDLEGLAPVSILGELPYASADRSATVPISGIQLEVLRSLRSALSFVWDAEGTPTLIVSSTVSGEGKTYVTRSLAYVYALAGHKVLLIDADLRRASLSQETGLRGNGLTLLLANPHLSDSDIEQAIVSYGRDNFFFLSAGPSAPNPPELLESPNMKNIIAYVQKNFDFIFIDTAPLGLVSDTLSIVRHTYNSVILYVFRADYSKISFLKHLYDLVQKNHLRKVYLLFNGTKLSKPRYGYGYGYGYYGKEYERKYYFSPSDRKGATWAKLREWLPL
ncbi:MAG: polysaccharide biosynthesis tyrosine autokinase [Bacteroidia bacterium]|nr:polysaccharide biosynthesis tyrosine autokinase [Bacteroidia bacterium]